MWGNPSCAVSLWKRELRWHDDSHQGLMAPNSGTYFTCSPRVLCGCLGLLLYVVLTPGPSLQQLPPGTLSGSWQRRRRGKGVNYVLAHAQFICLRKSHGPTFLQGCREAWSYCVLEGRATKPYTLLYDLSWIKLLSFLAFENLRVLYWAAGY